EDRRSSWVPPVSVSFICDNDSLYEFSQDYREFPPIDYYTSGKIYEYDNNSHILSLNNLKMIGYGKLKQMEVVYISNDSMQCIGPIIDDVSKDSLAVKSLIEFKADTIPSSYRDFVRKKQYHINIE
ncbi:MAG: hypothetical protein IJV24_08655, partial [Prevotella sp.]|nr:hypothetical protein [Prevotella sp.]